MPNLDAFTQAYITCALWSSTDDEGQPFDSYATAADLHETTLAKMTEECKQFQADNAELLRESGQSDEQSGHDFWLTRNGHGAGFWDRGLGEVGEKLTEAAKVWGSSDLYTIGDGNIHIS